tara:strand:- start:101 stop:688 length:588 start_codon:yes stop_codon:yes gene_type:complete
MPLINDSVYFVHIPRTGGRYVTELFRNNNYNLNFDNFDAKIILKDRELVELPHLSYPDYTLLFKKTNIKCFTVVRDPVTKFASHLKDKKVDLENIFYSKDNFLEFVNNNVMTDIGNWYLPQINFITKNTILWKYENGLNQDFIDWLHKNFGFIFEKTNVDYCKSKDYDEGEIILNKKQINFIKEYYYQDYKILGY